MAYRVIISVISVPYRLLISVISDAYIGHIGAISVKHQKTAKTTCPALSPKPQIP